jgi:SAM-dependent methyltransferase
MSDGDSHVSYPDVLRRRLAAAELESPWFRARNQAILGLTRRHGQPSQLVEIGAGNGIVALCLQAAGIAVTALEPSEIGAEIITARGLNVRCQMLEDAAFPSSSIEAVGLFDVIEHLSDPQQMHEEVRRILRPSGLWLITVPALQSMWSQIDEYSGTIGATTGPRISELGTAGLSPVSCEYRFFAALLPLAMMRVVPYRLGIRKAEVEVEAKVLRQLTAGGNTSARVIDWEMRLEERIGPMDSPSDPELDRGPLCETAVHRIRGMSTNRSPIFEHEDGEETTS